MIWRAFRRTRASDDPDNSAWWQEAGRLAGAPAAEAIARLEQAAARDADEAERRVEMIDGLRQLAACLAHADLPVVSTQHRVIGADVCHFVAPAGLADHSGGAGKLFLTSRRLIFIGASVVAVPWHRVRGVARAERDLIISSGTQEPLAVRCNIYGDALVARHLAERLRGGTT